MKAASNQLVSRFLLAGLCSMVLTACDPFEKQRAEQAEKTRIECLDKICTGDKPPPRPPGRVVFKLNGQWFTGPNEYGSPSLGAIAFYWPSKAASGDPDAVEKASEVVFNSNGSVGNFYDVAIEIFLRTNTIPPEPRGYQLIELAEAKDWIASRTTLRPGLDAITMRHVIGPRGYYIDHVTYYVATQLKGVDGLPPVATCAHAYPDDSGGTGFMWQPGIWAGTRMNQKHCADWPEIFQETTRVLQLLKKA